MEAAHVERPPSHPLKGRCGSIAEIRLVGIKGVVAHRRWMRKMTGWRGSDIGFGMLYRGATMTLNLERHVARYR